jgi:quercetin dioxygenase-like cupin family protein
MPQTGVRKYNWADMPWEKVTDAISRKIVTGEREMAAQVLLKKGAVVPTHDHESEQLTFITSGSLTFEIAGETIVLGAGDVLCIPSRVPHKATATEDTLEMDVFSPIRQDWLDKTDDYFRR